MNDLLFSLNAVFPIILVAAFGFLARKTGVIDEHFVKAGNKFCFKYGFFAMMFVNIYKIENLGEIRWNVVLFAVLVVLVLFIIGLFWILFCEKTPNQKGVIHQEIIMCENDPQSRAQQYGLENIFKEFEYYAK